MDIIASVLWKSLLLNGGPWNEDQFTLGGPTCDQNHNTCNSKNIFKDINLMCDQKSNTWNLQRKRYKVQLLLLYIYI
jgi:hypothetical protein